MTVSGGRGRSPDHSRHRHDSAACRNDRYRRPPMSAVAVSDLVVRYGDLTAVDGVSLAAEAEQVLALLGPNGAGKTTTVETIEGYRSPTAGTVRVLGLDPVAD